MTELTYFRTKHGGICAAPRSYFARMLELCLTYEENETLLALELVRSGDWFVDVGAHVGWFSTILARVGAHVVALEPNPQLLPYLRENLRDQPVEIFEVAAFETDGEAEFYMPSDYNDGWGSLAAPDPHGLGEMVTVKTRRLEELLPPGRTIRLLKLDVEGVELNALRGLGERLADVEHLLVECFDRPARTSRLGSTIEGIGKFLSGWSVRPVSEQNFLFTNPAVAA